MANSVKIDWKEVIKLGLILFAISAVAACLLALTNYVTAGTIKQLNLDTNTAARQQVLSEATDFQQVPADQLANIGTEIGLKNPGELVEAYVGTNNGNIVGYTVKTAPSKGYSGPVEMLTGITTDGVVQAIAILKQNETPGLGAKATLPEFKDQFNGKSALAEIIVVKSKPAEGSNEIQAITGATITSKAVTDGVNLANQIYQYQTQSK